MPRTFLFMQDQIKWDHLIKPSCTLNLGYKIQLHLSFFWEKSGSRLELRIWIRMIIHTVSNTGFPNASFSFKLVLNKNIYLLIFPFLIAKSVWTNFLLVFCCAGTLYNRGLDTGTIPWPLFQSEQKSTRLHSHDHIPLRHWADVSRMSCRLNKPFWQYFTWIDLLGLSEVIARFILINGLYNIWQPFAFVIL